MVDIIPSTDSTLYRLPLKTRNRLAADLADPGTPEGVVLAATTEAAVNTALEGSFNGGGGLYDFPGSAGTETITYEINATHYTASSTLEGQNTTIGATPIIVKPDAAPVGVYTVTGDGAAMYPTAGGATVPMYVDVASMVGISRSVIGTLASIGSTQGIGGFLCGRFVTGDARMLKWGLSATTRAYVLSKHSGTVLPGSGTALVASTQVAQPGDVVDLEFRNHTLKLHVNGIQILTYTLTAGEQVSYEIGTNAGVYGNSSATTPNIAIWQWMPDWPVGDKKMIAVDESLKLPEDVEFSDSMRAEIGGVAAGNRRFNIADYGAKMDAILLTDAATSSGLATVSSAARPFVAGDVGKTIAVMGAGPVVANSNDGVWISTILSVASGVATLASSATSTTTGSRCIFGTPDDTAIANTQVAATTAGGGTVYIPPGRTIVTAPLNVQNYVSWAGAGRELSWVHVVADRAGDASTAGTSDWLTCAGRDASSPLIGADFSDFGIEAEAMIHTAGYGSAIKPLNIYYVKRCSIRRMNVWHTPATAIPFDHSYDQVVIADNVIISPGRLAPNDGPGGSGIGAGTKGTGSTEPTLIMNNVIIGTQTSGANGPGHNGIFTEAQTGADPDLGVTGYRILNNVVIGMYYGISDTGSTGTLIQGNTIVGCSRGIRLAKTTLSAAYPGLHTIIANNIVRGCTGPGSTDGIGITIYTPTSSFTNLRSNLHTIIEGNQIFENKSWGVSINSAGGVHIDGVVVHGNQIRANGRSGVRLVSAATFKIRYPAIHGNQIVANGTGAVSGDRSGILVESGTTVEGGRIQNNDIYDLQGSPTQLATVTTTGATLTGVRVAGNTGDA
ncbi:Right handed beta helix region [Agromyces sp. CF514]|uniref:right-handed parallel beta-helix repeat-containing protein n=1 Tax=Agromyces sp. CF514 TaxID=1881031 RepID=UPI0008EFF49E|nr:right-handed parallel beta-helix repeat-containing protein [Agromyces sp. CF514]SFR76193.1 Right handed beta helix region [Agromyces sp. CF514]